ncbi:MAG: hypothetical protein II295_06305 [Akkermansia sp.]|nr:hypothetical protein [Akkermansia sp.]
MLAVISPLIARGVIDNTLQELIDLRLWFTDGSEPLHLRMKGNCLRDIAGCRLEFTNLAAGSPPAQMPSLVCDLREIAGTARFQTGDITYSRRVLEKDNRCGVGNILYIEFFVNDTLRILMEFSAVSYTLSLPQWEQSWEGDNLQTMLNMEALRAHVQANVKIYRGPAMSGLGEDMPPCDWDYRLNRAEACMAIYPSIHEKYGPLPGGYLSAAFVMNRTEFLGKEAAEEEANMPPDPETTNRDWDVVDFMYPYERDVRQAMHHPLFEEASHMTAIVQEQIMHKNGHKLRNSKEGAAFLSLYAGIVSHLLSTILLTSQERYPTDLASQRMEALCKRLSTLAQMLDTLPPDSRPVLQDAAESLMKNMRLFITSIPS